MSSCATVTWRVAAEIHRVLRGGGHVVVMSPNRWFPFEGHGLQLGSRKFAHPAPLVPWLPERLTKPALRARSNSAVATATYTINAQAAMPAFSPAGGTYTSAQSVSISDATSGATIRFALVRWFPFLRCRF